MLRRIGVLIGLVAIVSTLVVSLGATPVGADGEEPRAVFIAGSTTPPTNDRAIVARLEVDFDVVIVDDESDLAALDLADVDLLVISTSVTHALVGDLFVQAHVPIITWEAYLFDDMQLALGGETGSSWTEVSIVDPFHPLAAGFPATDVTVQTTATPLNFGTVCAEGDVVAKVPGAPLWGTVFSYDAGDSLCDGTPAPARRVALFPTWDGSGVLGLGGRALLDAAITWTQLGANCSTQSEIAENECDALVELYRHAGGPGWTDTGGWLDYDAGPCSWFGVTCSGGHVSELALFDNGLEGPIPDSMGALSRLRVLSLRGNELHGSIPDSIANLVGLESLALGSNDLTGTLPDWIGDLPNLEFLNLRENELWGPIPRSMTDGTALRALFLDGNNLAGEVPDLSLLPLEGLRLRNNGCLYTDDPALATFLEALDPYWNNGCPHAVMVAGNSNPPQGDRRIVERLNQARLRVTVVDDDSELADLDLDEIAVVLISTSVIPSKVGDTFADADVPVVVWEPYLFNDMALTAYQFGETSGPHSSITVLDPSHPLAAGYGGTVDVYTRPEKLNVAPVCDDATVVAHVPGARRHPTLFEYETGELRCDGTATPAPRIGLYMTYQGGRRLNYVSWQLMDAAVQRALMARPPN